MPRPLPQRDLIPLRPDIFDVTGSREEIAIDFGMVSDLAPDRNGVAATLETRVIMSPQIAARVATLLENNIRKYEAAFGELTQEVPPRPVGRTESDLLFDPVPGLSIDGSADRAAFLFESVERLGIPYAYERSFKLMSGIILPNRFLCGVKKVFLGDGSDGILIELCRKIGMPPQFLETFASRVHHADYVHFGFEEGVSGCIYKVYIEFDVGLKREHVDLRHMPAEPFELHIAFKWSPADESVRAVSRYTGFPFMTKETIEGRIADICRDAPDGECLGLTGRLLDRVYGKLPLHGFFYVEVREEGNPRVSFDVKVYEAGIPMREIFPIADGYRRHFAIPDDRFLPLYERIGDSTFGHVTGGIDRGGNEFLTLYFGVAWR